MKKLRLFLIAVFLTFSVFGQTEKGVVYLKNGTILKGRYLYFDNSEKIKVESGGNIWVFSVDELDTIVDREAVRNQKMQEPFHTRKFFLHAELGVLAGNSQNSQPAPFSFTATVNYQVTPQFSAGAGFGAEFLKESYLPAFLNLEYKFREPAYSPYLFLKGGYQVPLEDSREVYYDVWPAYSSSIWPGPQPSHGYGKLDPKGGVLINPGIGYSHFFSPGFGMSLGFGYQFHRLHYKGENDYGLDIDYNRLTVKIGFIFN
ncbi:MAG: hypothetical protein ACOCWK_03595 [Tangfeifania sp.]